MAQGNTFNTVDVETANPNQESICSIGIVQVQNSEIVDSWYTLVNPEDEFGSLHTSINGIDEQMVASSPTMPQIRDELRNRLRGSILVSHGEFDRIALEKAMDKYSLEQFQVLWLDSSRIVRRAWPERFSEHSHTLDNVAQVLEIELKEHHNALDDAMACAAIVIRACEESGISIQEWLDKSHEAVFSSRLEREKRITKKYLDDYLAKNQNLEGPLYGETVVFTGELTVKRKIAIDLAADAGCNVALVVNKKTNPTLLVVGRTSKRTKLAGNDKSSKHRQAEDLIREGHHMRLISEKDFCAMLELDPRIKIKGHSTLVDFFVSNKDDTQKEITYYEF